MELRQKFIMKSLKFLCIGLCLIFFLGSCCQSSSAQYSTIPQQPTGGPYYAPPIIYIPNYQPYNYPYYNYYVPRYNAPLWNYTPYHLYYPYRFNYHYIIR